MDQSDRSILLSIAIPTRSRAHYLRICLDHITAQFDDLQVKNSIEVVISDNDSQDNTRQVCEEYVQKFPNIKYFRNEKNIGFDGNTIAAVTKSRGKYCWHIGDDDFIQNGALKFIVDFLSKKEVAVLSIGFHPFVNHEASTKRVSNINESLIDYSTGAEEFYRKGFCEGILGIFMFNKDLWLKARQQITQYEGLGIYYEIIMRMIIKSPLPLAHLSYPVLFTGQDYKWNKNGTALFTFMYNVRLLKKLKTFGYSDTFINEELDLFSKSLPKVVIKAKATDLKYSFNNFYIIWKEFYRYPLYTIPATILLCLPNSLLKFLKKMKKQYANRIF
ncbi:glycosyltransferase [Candidatus Parcubacteria bacterium]|nr:glycosyltransferase [Candidatus Parcubacteria bacterium]